MSRQNTGLTSIRKNITALYKRTPAATDATEKSHRRSTKPPMPRRILTALVLAVIGLPAIIYGGVFYFLVIAIFLVGSAWEYVRLYRVVQFEPNEIVTVAGVLVIATARFFFAWAAAPLFVFFILLAMTVHLIAFERGRDQAGLDFAITIAGLTYLGWVGSYLLDLRTIVNGQIGLWWWFIVLPIVWAGDTGAYSIGTVYGRHKMSPAPQPEEKLGGIFCRRVYIRAGRCVFCIRFFRVWPQAVGRHDQPGPGWATGAVHRRPGASRRPGREHAQTPERSEGFEQCFPRTWWFSGPRQFVDLGRGHRLFHHPVFYPVRR